MRIGVLGGSFNPVHNGHLKVAEETSTGLNLARVIWIPAGEPPLKPDRSLAPAEHRLRMMHLAINGSPYFTVSTIEIDRAGTSYTVDTIAELREQVGVGDELFFILGWDSLAKFTEWREPSRLLTMCSLVAVPRPGWLPPDLGALEEGIPGISERVILMDKPRVGISSTEIRDRIARNLSIRHLVPEPVEQYIKTHRLYKS